MFFNANAQDENYAITPKGTNAAEIIVSGNCKIPLSAIQESIKTKIYGADNKGVQKFEENYDTKIKKNGIGLSYDTINGGIITIEYDKLVEETNVLTFFEGHETIKDNKTDWAPIKNKIISITIKKTTPVSPVGGNTPNGGNKGQIKGTEDNPYSNFDQKYPNKPIIPQYNSGGIDNSSAIKTHEEYQDDFLQETKKIVTDHHKRLNASKTGGKSIDFFPYLLSLLALALALLSYLRNNKKTKRLKKDYSELLQKMDDLSRKTINNNAPSVSSTPTMSPDEIKSFIMQEINQLKTSLSSASSSNQNGYQPSPSEQVKKEISDTDDVKWNQAGRFFTIEPMGKNKIFRIYQQRGEYYYTIVDDDEIRQEIAGMLQSFDWCISYQSIGSSAKRIEPVKPGKLRKVGDKFYVDPNNKLLVKFL